MIEAIDLPKVPQLETVADTSDKAGVTELSRFVEVAEFARTIEAIALSDVMDVLQSKPTTERADASEIKESATAAEAEKEPNTHIAKSQILRPDRMRL